MPASVDELIESAATGVLRALHARGNGQEAAAIVQSGFNIEFYLRAGGRRIEALDNLNPQPEPPGILNTGAQA